MKKIEEGVNFTFTPVDERSGFLQGHVVIGEETLKCLGALNEGTAYVAALQVLYATVVTNFGRKWTNDMLDVSVVSDEERVSENLKGQLTKKKNDKA